MSIELQEARKELDILENLANNPQLILTDLFGGGTSELNFLYQVNIKGKYILDYLIEYLKTLKIFNNTKLKFQSGDLRVYVYSLKHGEYQEYQPDDGIMEIDIENKTFFVSESCIKNYEKVMNENYELETVVLDEYWQKLTDLSLKNRLYQVKKLLFSNKKLHIKIADTYFWLVAVLMKKYKEKIKKGLDKEIARIDERNQYNEKEFYRKIDLQNFYKGKAPEHIKQIRSKQKEIVDYLVGLGYKEDNEKIEY